MMIICTPGRCWRAPTARFSSSTSTPQLSRRRCRIRARSLPPHFHPPTHSLPRKSVHATVRARKRALAQPGRRAFGPPDRRRAPASPRCLTGRGRPGQTAATSGSAARRGETARRQAEAQEGGVKQRGKRRKRSNAVSHSAAASGSAARRGQTAQQPGRALTGRPCWIGRLGPADRRRHVSAGGLARLHRAAGRSACLP